VSPTSPPAVDDRPADAASASSVEPAAARRSPTARRAHVKGASRSARSSPSASRRRLTGRVRPQRFLYTGGSAPCRGGPRGRVGVLDVQTRERIDPSARLKDTVGPSPGDEVVKGGKNSASRPRRGRRRTGCGFGSARPARFVGDQEGHRGRQEVPHPVQLVARRAARHHGPLRAAACAKPRRNTAYRRRAVRAWSSRRASRTSCQVARQRQPHNVVRATFRADGLKDPVAWRGRAARSDGLEHASADPSVGPDGRLAQAALRLGAGRDSLRAGGEWTRL